MGGADELAFELHDRSEREVPWIKRCDFLSKRGYQLRPRYQPNWTPPWGPDDESLSYEEGIRLLSDQTLDAVRVSDGQVVILKVIELQLAPHEIEIGKFLSSEDLRNDGRNHSIPLYDSFPDPLDPENYFIAVLPMLKRVEIVPFASVRECADYVHQTLEGVAFLHQHRVAHCDCTPRNILMDARSLFPKGWHPQNPWRLPDGGSIPHSERNPSRSAVGGVRYYLIDFGLSVKDQDRTTGRYGLVRAPELSDEVPYDPYKLDVYILGVTYKDVLIDKHPEMAMLKPLVDDMTKEAPEDRPTIAEVIKRFDEMRAKWGSDILGQRLRPEEPEWSILRMIRDVRYRMRDRRWEKNAKPVELPPFV